MAQSAVSSGGIALACPRCGQAIVLREGAPACIGCRTRYRVEAGVYDVIDDAESQAASTASYSSATPLMTRVRFFEQRFEHDFRYAEALKALTRGRRRVLEVGCGTMTPLLPIAFDYADAEHVWGVDTSLAMLARAARDYRANGSANFARADATHLPFGDAQFDLIWARHMLYHVRSPAEALEQCARVLRSDGVFCLSTNSKHNKPQVHELQHWLLDRLGLDLPPSSPDSRRFAAEDAAEHLAPHFATVFVAPYDGVFVFQHTDEFADYYLSTSYAQKILATGVPRTDLETLARAWSKRNQVLRLGNPGAVAVAAHGSGQLFAATFGRDR